MRFFYFSTGWNCNTKLIFLLLLSSPSQEGYFRTSKGSFFIEPIQEYVNENKNILHLLYRRPRIVNENGDVEECAVTNSHGEFCCFDFFFSFSSFKMPCHYLLFYCWAGATLKCSSVVCKICKLIVVSKRHVRKSHIGNIVRSPLTFVGKLHNIS